MHPSTCTWDRVDRRPTDLRLDALMGPQRDVAKKSKKDPAEDWRDDSVCKSLSAKMHRRFVVALSGQAWMHLP